MSLRIGSNTAAMTAQRDVANDQRQVQNSYKRLASGSRFSSLPNDSAGEAISDSLRMQMASLGQAERNAKMAQSIVQTAEGALNQQNNILVRLRELAISAASDTLTDKDRQYANQEFTQLTKEFDRIAQATQFGSRHLLNGTNEDFSIQVGTNSGSENQIQFKWDANTTASAIGVDDLDVSEKGDARDALSSLDKAVQNMAKVRAKFGAVQSRFNYAIDSDAVQKDNLAAANSRIADVDVAAESSRLAGAQVLREAAISVLAQANTNPRAALKLID